MYCFVNPYVRPPLIFVALSDRDRELMHSKALAKGLD